MSPERKITINDHLIEEFYWNGRPLVYLDNRVIDQTFEEVQTMVKAISPKFPKTYCSQCGGEFGPGDHGYSHCRDHR